MAGFAASTKPSSASVPPGGTCSHRPAMPASSSSSSSPPRDEGAGAGARGLRGCGAGCRGADADCRVLYTRLCKHRLPKLSPPLQRACSRVERRSIRRCRPQVDRSGCTDAPHPFATLGAGGVSSACRVLRAIVDTVGGTDRLQCPAGNWNNDGHCRQSARRGAVVRLDAWSDWTLFKRSVRVSS